jgi:gamma-glutamyltranspeptidase / glutathione hydrolase
MVAAAHPLAVEAGLAVLRSGGSAVDAAVAVQMMLGFVEAPETGIGGGGFLLYFDAARGSCGILRRPRDGAGRGRPDRFMLLGPAGAALVRHPERARGGCSRPGGDARRWPMRATVASRGRSWSALRSTAAEQPVCPCPSACARQSRGDLSLRLFGDTRRAFVAPAGEQPPLLRNPEYAATLRALAADGRRAFYSGAIGAALASTGARPAPLAQRPGARGPRRLYPLERAPVCGRYREWTVCGAPPPSSGGIAVLQMLGMLERFPLAELGADSAEADAPADRGAAPGVR